MADRDNPFYGKKSSDILLSRPVIYKVDTKHGLGDKLKHIVNQLTEQKSISYSKDAVTGHYIVRLEGYVIVLRHDQENDRVSLLTAYPAGDKFGGNPL